MANDYIQDVPLDTTTYKVITNYIQKLDEIRERQLPQVLQIESPYLKEVDYSTGIVYLREYIKDRVIILGPESESFAKGLASGTMYDQPRNSTFTAQLPTVFNGELYQTAILGCKNCSTYSIFGQFMYALTLLNKSGTIIMAVPPMFHSQLVYIIKYVNAKTSKIFNVQILENPNDLRQRFVIFSNYTPNDEVYSYLVELHVEFYKINQKRRKDLAYPQLKITEQGLINFYNSIDNPYAQEFRKIVKPLIDSFNLPRDIESIDNEFLELNDNTGQPINLVISDSVSYKTIRELTTERKLCFPYKRFQMPDLYDRFEKLIEFSPTMQIKQTLERSSMKFKPDMKLIDILKPHQPGLIYFTSKKSDYEMDIMTDYFTEPARMESYVKTIGVSPSYFWLKNADWCVNQLRNPKPLGNENKSVISSKEKVTTYNLREFLYKTVKESNQFKSTLSKSIYDYIGEKMNKKLKVLDPCGGWGDRLIGALASDWVSFYKCVDPNPDLHSGYAEIREFFSRDEHAKTQTVQGLAQNINYSDEYDLVFTSPPYWDYETYNGSDQFNNSLDMWKQEFLYPMLTNSLNSVVVDGIVAIHLTDVAGIEMCESMYNHMKKLSCKFIGCFVASSKSNIPIWCWKKIESRKFGKNEH